MHQPHLGQGSVPGLTVTDHPWANRGGGLVHDPLGNAWFHEQCGGPRAKTAKIEVGAGRAAGASSSGTPSNGGTT